MYKRIYKLFSHNNHIYSLQKWSTVHALISLTESIINNLGDENIGCGSFADLEKAFDTVENDICLSTLEHYGVPWLANE